MNQSKATVVFSGIMGKLRSIAGYFLGIFSIIVFLGFLVSEDPVSSEDRSALIFVFIIFALALYLIYSGSKVKRRIKRFKRYVGLMSNEHMTSIQALASATGQTVDFVIKDIQTMIEKKFFANAWLDLNRGEIVLGHNFQNAKAPTRTQAQPQAAQARMEVVQCSGCGASNNVEAGKVTRCEFCDTAVTA